MEVFYCVIPYHRNHIYSCPTTQEKWVQSSISDSKYFILNLRSMVLTDWVFRCNFTWLELLCDSLKLCEWQKPRDSFCTVTTFEESLQTSDLFQFISCFCCHTHFIPSPCWNPLIFHIISRGILKEICLLWKGTYRQSQYPQLHSVLLECVSFLSWTSRSLKTRILVSLFKTLVPQDWVSQLFCEYAIIPKK